MNRAKRTRPWWMWVVGAIGLVVILSAIAGGGGHKGASEPSAVAAPPRVGTRTATTAEAVASTDTRPIHTLADARDAADAGHYADAVAIASDVGPGPRAAIRRRISNRIARRAASAVRSGNRASARSLLAQARRYPATAATRGARADYAAAQARAAARRSELRRAAAQRRTQRAAARAAQRAATKAAQAPTSDCDPNYSGACLNPASPDYDCAGGSGNGPDYTGTVQVIGSDHFDLDRDGDGTGCDG